LKKFTAIIVVIIFALYLGCGVDDGIDSRPGTSRVTLHLGGPSSGKPSAQSIPSAVSKIRITVSGSGMTTMEKTLDAAGQTTITATLDVPTGRERTFLVEALDSTGTVLYNGSKTADLTGIAVTLDIALADFVPTGLSARAFSSMRIVLSWTASADPAGTAGYNIYNDGVKIATVTAASYSHTGLSADIQYCYTVSALNARGSESLQSSESCATTSPAAFSKTFVGTIGEINVNSIQQTTDGGYILAGEADSFGAGRSDFFVLKLNPDGTVAWQKTYGGTSSDMANSIQQTTDGGYIVAGRSSSFGAGGTDAWVLKLNPDGTVAWQKTYGETGTDMANSIQQTSDGGYIVAGRSSSFGAGVNDAWVLRLNPDGSVAWQMTYGDTGHDYANSVQQTSDGGYIVAGYSYSFGAGGGDAWVLKLDPDGTVAWQKTYGGTGWDPAWSVQQTSDGGYIVAGWTNSFGAGGYDAWVLKLNPDGTVAWQKTYGPSWDDWVNYVTQTMDGFIMAGSTCPFSGSCDLWVLKVNADGDIGCGMSEDQSIAPIETSSSPVDTSCTPVASSATVYDPSVTPQDTAVIIDTQCSGATGGPSRMRINSIEFPDTNLETCVNTYAASQGYTYADQLTLLSCISKDIADITGIEWFTSLTELRIYNNFISDISALSGLTNLTVLYLDSNLISDISALSGLINLTEMSLYGNSVIDVSPLSGLTNFTELYLNNNSITQGVATLTGLTNAWTIDLRGNNSIPCADLAILEAALPGVVMHSVTCP
jgi:uncharacterized delta-60 repeat protein